jgi:hypothetical protein
LQSPALITAFLATCTEQGEVVKVVDSGKLLMLPADAAAEMQAFFKHSSQQIQHLLSPSIEQAAAASPVKQLQTRTTKVFQSAMSYLLTKVIPKQRSRSQPSSTSSRAGGMVGNRMQAGTRSADGTSQASSSSSNVQRQQQQQQQQQPAQPTDAVAAPVDPAVLYAYEHCLVPVMKQWGALFASDDMAAVPGSGLQLNLLPQAPAALHAVTSLLNLLVENELWACSLLVLGRFPALARHVRRSGLTPAGDATGQLLINQLVQASQLDSACSAAASPPPLLQQLQGLQSQQTSHLRQQQTVHQAMQQLQQQQQHMQGFQAQRGGLPGLLLPQQVQQPMLPFQANARLLLQYQQSSEPTGLLLLMQHLQLQQLGAKQASVQHGMQPPVGHMQPAQPRSSSPVGSDDSVESADEILVRLGLLQQARWEQEALGDIAQMEVQAEQQQHHGDPHTCFSDVWSQPLPVAQPHALAEAVSRSAPLFVLPAMSPANAPSALMSSGQPCCSSAAEHPAEHPAEQQGTQQLDNPQHAAAGLPPVQAAAAGPSSAAAACCDASSSSGLRQRRPAAVAPTFAGISNLLSKQRQLSWEEEQPEAVPSPPPLPVYSPGSQGSGNEGWYPGSWQLPEPTPGMLFARGGLAAGGLAAGGLAAGFLHMPHPPLGMPAQQLGVGALPGFLQDDDEDPYTQPSHAAGISYDRQQQLQQQDLLEQQIKQQLMDQQLWEQQQHNMGACDQLEAIQSPFKGTDAHEGQAAGSIACGSDTGGDCSKRSSCDSKQGACRATCGGGGGNSSGRAANPGLALLQPAGGLSWQQPLQLISLCAQGFSEPCVEASYLVFKNHGCSLLDATAGFLCTSMLVTSSMRTISPWDWDSCLQLLVMVAYAALFFIPYIVMQLHTQLFLRLREGLLVVGRNLGALFLMMMALGYLPMVQIWKNVVVNTLALQIQNGVILPACQQVRLPAALLIALVHVPADAVYLSVGRPLSEALAHSVLMQLVSVLVALVFDVWCRLRFLQRYSGVTAVQR